MQNASLEIAWTQHGAQQRTIAGTSSCHSSPRATRASTSTIREDWWYAEYLMSTRRGEACPPSSTAFVSRDSRATRKEAHG